MRRQPVTLTIVALAVIFTGTPRLAGAGSEEDGSPAPADGSLQVLEHLSGIDRSLHEISILLTSLLDQQQVSVLLGRLELKERSLAPLRGALERARADRDGIHEETQRLRVIQEQWERERTEAAQDSLTDGINQAQEGEMRRLRAELERMQEREAVLDQRILEMEDDLARRRDDILALEEMVDARLGLR